MQERITKAGQQLQAKYANTNGSHSDNSVTVPTGTAYKEQNTNNVVKVRAPESSTSSVTTGSKYNANGDGDDYDDDDDIEIRELREARKKKALEEHNEKLENLAKGHGQYREIAQDEFLTEVTTSKLVICHFYHRDFPKCKVMDHHLNIIANRHIETKFIKINAEKAMFFVEKVIIEALNLSLTYL